MKMSVLALENKNLETKLQQFLPLQHKSLQISHFQCESGK